MTTSQRDSASKTESKRQNTKRSRRIPQSTSNTTSKLDLIVSMLTKPEGTTLADLASATGWQAHSVRGALAGALKKKGHSIISEKVDGQRRYRIRVA